MRLGGRIPETRGDVLMQSLWEIQTEAIIDIRFLDSDVDAYKIEGMDKILTRWGEMNKDKHRHHCHEQLKHCYPLFLLIDGMIGKENQVVLVTLI